MRTDDVMEMCNKEAYSDKTNIIQTVTTDCLTFMKSEYFKGIIESNKVCIITDPPFNIGYRYNTYKDNKKESEYYGFLKDVFTLYNLPFVVVHYPECLHKISFYIGKFPEKIVSWVYNSNTAKQHRDIAFYGVKPDFRKIKQPYKNPNDKRIRERMKNGAGGGEIVRLVECESGEECIKETKQPSLCNACRGDGKDNRNTARRIFDIRSFCRKWNNRGCVCEVREQLHRL